MKARERAKLYTAGTEGKPKLVPIDRTLATACIAEAQKTETGYYETVNRRIETQPELLERLEYLLRLWEADEPIEVGDMNPVYDIIKKARGNHDGEN